MSGIAEIRSLITMTWDDNYGSAIEGVFQLCEMLYYLGEDIPAQAEFRNNGHVLNSEEDFIGWHVMELVDDGIASIEDARYWVRVLSRFLDQIPEEQRY